MLFKLAMVPQVLSYHLLQGQGHKMILIPLLYKLQTVRTYLDLQKLGQTILFLVVPIVRFGYTVSQRTMQLFTITE